MSSGPGKLAGRVALITGASRGIGRGIAEVFGREGARLALFSRSDAAFPGALNLTGDVAEEPAVESAFQAALGRYGRLDILVNNAAQFHQHRIDELAVLAMAALPPDVNLLDATILPVGQAYLGRG